MRSRVPVAVLVTAALVSLAIVVGLVIWMVRDSTSGNMIASSEQPGHGASLALPGIDGSWRARAETTGAWIQRNWRSDVDVNRVVLRSDPSVAHSTSGFLRFSDGSQLMVQLDRSSTVVSMLPRHVAWMRFTFLHVPGTQTTVGLAEFTADGKSGPDGIVTNSASPNGDVASEAQVTGASAPVADASGQRSFAVDGAVELRWSHPFELTRVAIAGADGGSRLTSGTLEFSDGSSLPVGAVTSDATRPTTVAFMPRSTTSVRLVVGATAGQGALRLASIHVYQRGAAPDRPSRPPEATTSSALNVPCVASGARPSDKTGVEVLCPTNGSVVGQVAHLRVAAGPSYASVSAVAWTAGGGAAESVRATLDPRGQASLAVDVSAARPGPFVVAVSATPAHGMVVTVYLQLVRPGAMRDGPSDAPPGRTLAFDETFDGRLSTSRSGEGADYTFGKPERSAVADFGGALFADPSLGLGNVGQSSGYLRLSTLPRPGFVFDPQGQQHFVGGMVASARPGGSGFSTQYGYFEARIFAPAEPGTWPAFWLLTNPNLVREQSVVAEIDAVELYGHDPVSACHTSHQYPDPKKVGLALCGQRWASAQDALRWHTYGVDVRPDGILYYIDGKKVGEAPQVRGADQPMFFMLDLALGGGWPIDLSSLEGRTSLYVDWVRVYV